MSVTITATIITRNYLMNKSKHDLASLVLDYADENARLHAENEKLQNVINDMGVAIAEADNIFDTFGDAAARNEIQEKKPCAFCTEYEYCLRHEEAAAILEWKKATSELKG